jgi:alkanesulfonate monooxygenase SsuD/methylene tetrahydromethanopterin reductase-like flavin-dependent oxidoreductase (luciferase family)
VNLRRYDDVTAFWGATERFLMANEAAHNLMIGICGTLRDKPGYYDEAYLAAVTEKVKLGTLVTGVIYREPAFLVKQVTGLDVLSGGRAYFGVGAAWYEEEAVGMGFPFPPVATRFEMLEETLQIAHQMFKDDRSPYEGKHYQLKKPILSPQPLTKPYPPIMIGGMGEKKTLKFVAQYADATNLFLRAGMETLKHKLDVLGEHCQTFDRDVDEIANHRFDVAPHVADLGELRCFDLHERCARELREPARDFRLTNTGRSDHDDVARRDLVAEIAGNLLAAPTVSQSNGDRALGLVLTDDVPVELANGFSRGEVPVRHPPISSTTIS